MLRLLFAGRLVSSKGAHTAVEAMQILDRRGVHNVSLTIAGVPSFPWDYAQDLRNTIDSNRAGSVRLVDPVPNDKIAVLYRHHNALVFPSIGDEGFPVSLIEAMASGLAVVSTTTGGSAEILEDGVNSLTFSPGNAAELADCIQRLADDPQLLASLATAGQELVREKFDINRVADQTLEYLASVTALCSESALIT
jgi:glycosyltransferase involved in cell wall biosynthesis